MQDDGDWRRRSSPALWQQLAIPSCKLIHRHEIRYELQWCHSTSIPYCPPYHTTKTFLKPEQLRPATLTFAILLASLAVFVTTPDLSPRPTQEPIERSPTTPPPLVFVGRQFGSGRGGSERARFGVGGGGGGPNRRDCLDEEEALRGVDRPPSPWVVVVVPRRIYVMGPTISPSVLPSARLPTQDILFEHCFSYLPVSLVSILDNFAREISEEAASSKL